MTPEERAALMRRFQDSDGDPPKELDYNAAEWEVYYEALRARLEADILEPSACRAVTLHVSSSSALPTLAVAGSDFSVPFLSFSFSLQPESAQPRGSINFGPFFREPLYDWLLPTLWSESLLPTESLVQIFGRTRRADREGDVSTRLEVIDDLFEPESVDRFRCKLLHRGNQFTEQHALDLERAGDKYSDRWITTMSPPLFHSHYHDPQSDFDGDAIPGLNLSSSWADSIPDDNFIVGDDDADGLNK